MNLTVDNEPLCFIWYRLMISQIPWQLGRDLKMILLTPEGELYLHPSNPQSQVLIFIIFFYCYKYFNNIYKMGCTGSRTTQKKAKDKRKPESRDMAGCKLIRDTKKGLAMELGAAFVATTMPGWREENEDAFLVKFLSSNVALFGVFDGHSGAEISLFAKQNFPQILKKTKSFQSGSYSQALKETFIALDRLLISREGKQSLQQIHEQLKNQGRQANSSNPEFLAGSTGLVAIVTKQNIYVANSGDSKGIFIRNNIIQKQTEEHRADLPKELERITKNGGEVFDGRIDGNLNVSRGFGDFAHKPGNDIHQHIVSVIPDLYEFSRQDIDYMILGSDGIWEKPSSQVWEALKNMISNKQGNNNGNIVQIMQESIEALFLDNLGYSKIDCYGTDNMTAIVINLQQSCTGSTASTYIP